MMNEYKDDNGLFNTLADKRISQQHPILTIENGVKTSETSRSIGREHDEGDSFQLGFSTQNSSFIQAQSKFCMAFEHSFTVLGLGYDRLKIPVKLKSDVFKEGEMERYERALTRRRKRILVAR